MGFCLGWEKCLGVSFKLHVVEWSFHGSNLVRNLLYLCMFRLVLSAFLVFTIA